VAAVVVVLETADDGSSGHGHLAGGGGEAIIE
jgi:hypothetical protein